MKIINGPANPGDGTTYELEYIKSHIIYPRYDRSEHSWKFDIELDADNYYAFSIEASSSNKSESYNSRKIKNVTLVNIGLQREVGSYIKSYIEEGDNFLEICTKCITTSSRATVEVVVIHHKIISRK